MQFLLQHLVKNIWFTTIIDQYFFSNQSRFCNQEEMNEQKINIYTLWAWYLLQNVCPWTSFIITRNCIAPKGFKCLFTSLQLKIKHNIELFTNVTLYKHGILLSNFPDSKVSRVHIGSILILCCWQRRNRGDVNPIILSLGFNTDFFLTTSCLIILN